MTTVAVAFGSNVGDRARHIGDALERLSGVILIGSVSGLYETEPMYVVDQPSFFNGVVVGSTDFGPLALVRELKRIEFEVGRLARDRNGPREIDLDLIVYGSLSLSSNARPAVTLPHPRLAERRFVLEPLAEIAPDLVIPGAGIVSELAIRPEVRLQCVRRVGDAAVSVPSH